MKRRLSIRGIVYKEGKILSVKLSGYATGKANDYWCLPGGGLDEGEDLVGGLKREFIEETGIEPEIGSLLYIQQFIHNEMDNMEFIFHIKNTDDYLNIDLSRTTHGNLEIDELAFVDPTKVYIQPKFLSDLDVDKDIKSGKTAIFNFI